MTNGTKQQSNPFSTGGGGPNFETRVQAAFAVFMLAGGNAPCLPSWPIQKIKLQGKYAGYNTDDFIVFTKDPNMEKKAKLLAQVKHTINITESSEVFSEVIQSAWKDFTDPDIFVSGSDAIALITGPLNATDINDVRPLFEWARYSENGCEFIRKVSTKGFSSESKRKKLIVIREHLKKANGGKDISEDELWRFLKSYHLLGYDLDTESGVTLSLIKSFIARCSTDNASSVWSRIVDTVQTANQGAGTLTPAIFPNDIREVFNTSQRSSWNNDLKKLYNHGSLILESIRADIGGITIERADSFSKLLEMSEGSEFVFITGGRGCGKSSLAKKFFDYLKDRAPIFCFRTEDFNESHLDMVFSKIGLKGTLDEIGAGFALMPKKYLLIESLEKLLELQNTKAFIDLINFIRKDPGWMIIATGRDYAFQQIVFNFLRPYGIQCSPLKIGDFNDNDIQYLCEKLEPLKPFFENHALKQLIMNPFVAELAYSVAQTGPRLSIDAGELEFREAVWRNVISKESERKEGMPLKRRQVFIKIAVNRAKRMVYGVPANDYESGVLEKLDEEHLIRWDHSKELVNPAHDVLEDWALEKYIENAFQKNPDDIQDFFNEVGNEPAMNRAFRLWLHQRLRCGQDINDFTLKLLADRNIARNWQDETISAVLLGENPYEFLQTLKDSLFANDGALLKRFCFILRVSCMAPDRHLTLLFTGKEDVLAGGVNSFFLKPHGRGWEAVIHFLFENKDSIKDDLLTHSIAVLDEWCSVIHIDQALPAIAHEAGLIALHLLPLLKDDYRDSKKIKKLLIVIIKVSPSLSKEFNELLEKDVFMKSEKWQRPLYVEEFVSICLNDMVAAFLCKNFPDVVIRLAKQEWFLTEIKKGYHNWELSVEKCFSLNKNKIGSVFLPPSGEKGPFSHLLRFHQRKGLDFIIELCNRAAGEYANSSLDSPGRHFTAIPIPESKKDIQIELQLADGTVIKQYCSQRLWNGYRGYSGLPGLLQSALMALENYLIGKAEHFISAEEIEEMECLFDHILRNSNSVMTTAVLASIATGFPNKLGKAAFPILRRPEFYSFDLSRCSQEEPRLWIGFDDSDPLSEVYLAERRKANSQPWRKKSLEDLLLHLQFSDLREEVMEILDSFRQTNSLDPDLQEHQQKAQEPPKLLDRLITLNLWSVERAYYANWEVALKEAKNLCDIALNSNSTNGLALMYFGGIVKAAAIFLRDYSHELIKEDAAWCIGLILQIIRATSYTKHTIEIMDKSGQYGADTAASVLPIIFDYTENDEERLDIKSVIATALTHSNYYVRKETANGIREQLWKRDADFAQKCIEGAIEFARLYLDEINKERFANRAIEYKNEKTELDKSDEWIDSFRDQFVRGQITATPVDISLRSHNPCHILCPCLMIPDGSTESNHMALWSKVLSIFIEAEKTENKYSYVSDQYSTPQGSHGVM